MTSAFSDSTSFPGYSPQTASWKRAWASWMAARTCRSEEKGSFRVVAMFCTSTAGERMSASSRSRGLPMSAGRKPWRRRSSGTPGVCPHQTA